MSDNGKEAVLIMLLTELVRRQTRNGKKRIQINRSQLERVFENRYEVDYSESDGDKFILRLVEGEPPEEEDEEDVTLELDGNDLADGGSSAFTEDDGDED